MSAQGNGNGHALHFSEGQRVAVKSCARRWVTGVVQKRGFDWVRVRVGTMIVVLTGKAVVERLRAVAVVGGAAS